MEAVRPVLEKVVSDTMKKVPSMEAPLLAWPLVCGSAVANKTRALECRQGVLRIEVPDNAWSRQLNGFVPEYLGAMKQLVTEDVNRIEFVVSNGNGNGSKPNE